MRSIKKEEMNVEIVTIGDELLIGQVVDTNSAWIGRELNRIGGEILRITSVRDRMEEILAAFGEASDRADVVLVTGGLGPTKDDITKQALCRYFDTELVFDASVEEHIGRLLGERSLSLNASTRSQADVPDGCVVLPNRSGTAPAMWFERGERVLVSMPGVPYEMRQIMTDEVIPRLAVRFSDGNTIVHRSCWVRGFTESALSEFLEAYERTLPEAVRLAYLPSAGVVRLRLTGRGHDRERTETVLADCCDRLQSLLGDRIFGEGDLSLPEIAGRLLRERGWTLATAESCTSGGVAAAITSVAGSSAYFKGGVVAYANEVKERVLGVSAETLSRCGAVSAETVEQMCEGAMSLLHTDCAVAVSGIAGPDGGTPEKPVGTVWIGVRTGERTECRLFRFGKERETNTLQAVQTALTMLIERLSEGGESADREKKLNF